MSSSEVEFHDAFNDDVEESFEYSAATQWKNQNICFPSTMVGKFPIENGEEFIKGAVATTDNVHETCIGGTFLLEESFKATVIEAPSKVLLNNQECLIDDTLDKSVNILTTNSVKEESSFIMKDLEIDKVHNPLKETPCSKVNNEEEQEEEEFKSIGQKGKPTMLINSTSQDFKTIQSFENLEQATTNDTLSQCEKVDIDQLNEEVEEIEKILGIEEMEGMEKAGEITRVEEIEEIVEIKEVTEKVEVTKVEGIVESTEVETKERNVVKVKTKLENGEKKSIEIKMEVETMTMTRISNDPSNDAEVESDSNQIEPSTETISFKEEFSHTVTEFDENVTTNNTVEDATTANTATTTTNTNTNTTANTKDSDSTPSTRSYLGSWGGVFSVLGEISSTVKAKASTQIDKIYDSLDPNLPKEKFLEMESSTENQDEDPKSIKGLLDKLEPKSPPATLNNEGGGGSSWLSSLDKTFDFASDRLGQALLGGIKKFESTVGVSIEPILSSHSSSSSLRSSSIRQYNSDFEDSIIGGCKDQKDNETCSIITSSTPVSTTESDLGKFGKNIYSAGLSTLERLGRTTADIVVSTRERLVLMRGGEDRIDRTELKKSFSQLFDEFTGNDVLERLQLGATQASIELKGRLKMLNPIKLKTVQGSLRGIGASLDSVKACKGDIDWELVGVVFSGKEEEFVKRLKISIKESLARINHIKESVEALHERLDTPLPLPDNATLILYLVRFNLAKLLSAELHLLLLVDFSLTKEELLIASLAESLMGILEKAIDGIEREDLLLDSTRHSAIVKLLEADISKAQSTLEDAVQTLSPHLKLAHYYHCFGMEGGKNSDLDKAL